MDFNDATTRKSSYDKSNSSFLSILGTMLCILFSTAKGRILRSNCGDYADFSHIQNGMALQGHLLETFIGLLPKQCEEECINHINCKSINVEESGERRCELNRKSAADPSDRVTLIARNGWTFKGTDYSDQWIGNLCKRIRPCYYGFLCMDVCYSPGYKCHKCKELSSGMPCRMGPDLMNIARGKPTTQISTLEKKYVSRYAVDGYRGIRNNKNHFVCAMTDHRLGAWWRVDFGKLAEIMFVTAYGRGEENLKYYQNKLRIMVKKTDDGPAEFVSEQFSLVNPNHIKTINFGPHTIGRFLYLISEKEYLTICECEVMGYMS